MIVSIAWRHSNPSQKNNVQSVRTNSLQLLHIFMHQKVAFPPNVFLVKGLPPEPIEHCIEKKQEREVRYGDYKTGKGTLRD